MNNRKCRVSICRQLAALAVLLILSYSFLFLISTRSEPFRSSPNFQKKKSKIDFVDVDVFESAFGKGDDDDATDEDGTVSVDTYPLSMLRDVGEEVEESDVPLFLHVMKSGGTTMKAILRACYGLKRPKKILQNESLTIVDNFVNVNTDTRPGIQKAKELGLIPSKLAEVISSPRFFDSLTLFNRDQRARAFTVFRHPIDRITSHFYYMKRAYWEASYALYNTTNMTFLEYIENRSQSNYVTRVLTNKFEGELDEFDLESARYILETKFIVGFLDHLDVLVERLERTFGWKLPEKKAKCVSRLISDPKNVGGTKHNRTEEGSREWEMLAQKNSLDIRLYETVRKRFESEQEDSIRKDILNMMTLEEKTNQDAVSSSLNPMGILRGITEPVDPSDVTLFWQIPDSGVDVGLRAILRTCYGLNIPKRTGQNESHADINITQNDVIMSPMLYDTLTSLAPSNQHVRMFTVLRHPIERIYDTYSHSSTNATFLQYITDLPASAHNWMTRQLNYNRRPMGKLNATHVKKATEILFDKYLVGFRDDFAASLEKFQRFFGWELSEHRGNCVSRLVSKIVEEETIRDNISVKEWKLLSDRNALDMELYEKAKLIFKLQGSKIG